VDLVNQDEIGVLKTKLSKISPTVAFRPEDESFPSKLKKLFNTKIQEDGEAKREKLQKYS
jgi:hypothetical protein